MFHREAEMTAPVRRWLESQRLIVKAEFVTAWGECDLVGLQFNRRHVGRRLQLRQSRAIGSELRAAILLAIPDVETGQALSANALVEQFAADGDLEYVHRHVNGLIDDRFVVRTDGGLQRVNGWMPLHRRIVAVELKLRRLGQVVAQALANLAFADESYVALPADVARRSLPRLARHPDPRASNLGVLAVTPEICRVLRRARQDPTASLDPLRVYCAEKFWRTRLKDSSASTARR